MASQLPEGPMIDWERVHDLRQEVGAREFEEVVDLFLEEVDEVMARLRRAPDPATFEEDLHFLKGSAMNLGFTELVRLCQAGESAAAAGRADTVDLGPVLASYDVARAAFLAGLAAGLAA
jgi:HPt (histidine-containing phosphotransfer) domain-containing protein